MTAPPAARPPVKTTTFDITPSKPRPTGLSPGDKALLALAGLALLGAGALVADTLSARDGYTPAGGFEQLEQERSADAQAPGSPSALTTQGDAPASGDPVADLIDRTIGAPQPAAAPPAAPTASSSPSPSTSSSSSASSSSASSSTSVSATATSSPSSSSSATQTSSTTSSGLPDLPCVPLPPLVTC